MPLLITTSRIKIRNDLGKLRVGRRLGCLLKNKADRMSAYYFARELKIRVAIRESLTSDGFEVTRIK